MSLDIYLERERYFTYDKITFERDDEQVYWGNITHNLAKMANEAGLYDALWRPFKLLDNYKLEYEEIVKDYEYDFEENNIVRAKDISTQVQIGLNNLINNKKSLTKFNPDNGFGDYQGLIKLVKEYLVELLSHPDAIITVSR